MASSSSTDFSSGLSGGYCQSNDTPCLTSCQRVNPYCCCGKSTDHEEQHELVPECQITNKFDWARVERELRSQRQVADKNNWERVDRERELHRERQRELEVQWQLERETQPG